MWPNDKGRERTAGVRTNNTRTNTMTTVGRSMTVKKEWFHRSVVVLTMGAACLAAAGIGYGRIGEKQRPPPPLSGSGTAFDPSDAQTRETAIAALSGADSPARDSIEPSALAALGAVDAIEGAAPPAVGLAALADLGQSSKDEASTELSTVKRLRLRVAGLPEMSGEYGIHDGTISIPGVGRISVRGKRLVSLEAFVSGRLSQLHRREIHAALEVDRYLPFYVTGRVANAGEHDWRHGLTLIQAIALAGGIVTSSRNGGDALEGPGSTVQLLQVRTQIRFSIAQLERLKAEREGRDKFEPSARLIELERAAATQSTWSLEAFAARQGQLLAQQQAGMRTKIESLQRERDAALKEAQANEKQAAAVDEQLGIARELLKGSSKLRDKQLVANTRFMQQQSDLLSAEVKASEARTAAVKSHARVAGLDRQISAVSQERRQFLNERIETLEREVEQHELTLAAAGGSGRRGATAVKYDIARKNDQVIRTRAADLFSEILPGDVVIVSDATEQASRVAKARVPGNTAVEATASTRARTQSYIDASGVAPGGHRGRAASAGTPVRQ